MRRGAAAHPPAPAGARPEPLCIAHRGASARAPENTLAAFDAALRAGADALEFDVRLTRDGVPIVLHDATLGRTTSGHGPADALTLAELRGLDAGAWFAPRFRGERVPTLAETLDFAHGRCGVNIELKCGDARGAARRAGGRRRLETEEAARLASAVAAMIARARFRGLLIVSSFSRPALAAARASMPEARLGLLASRSARGLRSAHARLRLFSFHPHLRMASARRLRVARQLGLQILVWPVNDLKALRRVSALGVEGVMSDDPALLRGHWPSPRPGRPGEHRPGPGGPGEQNGS